ncbi:hypothetical protein Ancab_021775 [Ancistrocladus abbreviatus]
MARRHERWATSMQLTDDVSFADDDEEDHSSARVNACPMGTQAINDETQAAPQISAGKQLQIGEKKNKVAELGDRVLWGKGMSGDAEKGGFTTDILLGEKVAEEWKTEGLDETLGNQTKGDRLDTTAMGKDTMGCGANRDRAECSKAQITQEESDGLEIHLATLLKKKKGAFREHGQQSQETAGSHRKKKEIIEKSNNNMGMLPRILPLEAASSEDQIAVKTTPTQTPKANYRRPLQL